VTLAEPLTYKDVFISYIEIDNSTQLAKKNRLSFVRCTKKNIRPEEERRSADNAIIKKGGDWL
jgi:hypothetical protein